MPCAKLSITYSSSTFNINLQDYAIKIWKSFIKLKKKIKFPDQQKHLLVPNRHQYLVLSSSQSLSYESPNEKKQFQQNASMVKLNSDYNSDL